MADDHPLVRKAMVDLLAEEKDFEIVAACADGGEALEAVQEHNPDVAVLDVRMPEVTGLDIMAFIRAEGLGTNVILLTASIDDGELLGALSMGLDGLLLKDTPPEELVRGIREVAAGRHFLPKEVIDAARDRVHARGKLADRLLGLLTERERQIATYVAEGLSNKMIADQLDIAPGTVKVHLHNIYQKLDVTNRSALAVRVVSHMSHVSGMIHARRGSENGTRT